MNASCRIVSLQRSLIAAAIIGRGAPPLERDQTITSPSPRLVSVVSDSVVLARIILRRVVGSG